MKKSMSVRANAKKPPKMNTEKKPVRIACYQRTIRYLCPKCGKPLTFQKRYLGKSLCFRCGQALDWDSTKDICVAVVHAADSDEAAWIADQYYTACQMNENDWFPVDQWRQTLKGENIELYLLFMNRKAYGRFMRIYAKEGQIYDG